MEPNAGEMLCRQFDLRDPSCQNDNRISTDIIDHLNLIILKSKKRHEELVNERERQKTRHSDRDRDRRERKSEDRKELGSHSPDNKDSPRSDNKDSSEPDGTSSERKDLDTVKPITAPYSNNSHQNSSYYPNQNSGNYYQRNRDYNQSSFRLAFETRIVYFVVKSTHDLVFL